VFIIHLFCPVLNAFGVDLVLGLFFVFILGPVGCYYLLLVESLELLFPTDRRIYLAFESRSVLIGNPFLFLLPIGVLFPVRFLLLPSQSPLSCRLEFGLPPPGRTGGALIGCVAVGVS